MAFMNPEITDKQNWFKVTVGGIVYYDANMFTRNEVAKMENVLDDSQIEEIKGYGARFSASGYLDCTEWTVFDSLKEAEQFIADESEDDENTDEEEDSL